MPISDDLLNDIRTVIGNIPSNLTSLSSVDNIYEVYLFTLVLKAAQREGAAISLSDTSTLHFRTSPGFISSNRRNYTYASITFSSKPPLEAHVSIRVSGKSHVLHECDICVLLQTEADLCRNSTDRLAPRSSKIVLNIEAKFYTTSLSLGLGRSFLGLTTDLSSGKSFFVTNSESTSVEKLLAHRDKGWDHKIKPGNALEVERVISAFQHIFKDFKAKN